MAPYLNVTDRGVTGEWAKNLGRYNFQKLYLQKKPN